MVNDNTLRDIHGDKIDINTIKQGFQPPTMPFSILGESDYFKQKKQEMMGKIMYSKYPEGYFKFKANGMSDKITKSDGKLPFKNDEVVRKINLKTGYFDKI